MTGVLTYWYLIQVTCEGAHKRSAYTTIRQKFYEYTITTSYNKTWSQQTGDTRTRWLLWVIVHGAPRLGQWHGHTLSLIAVWVLGCSWWNSGRPCSSTLVPSQSGFCLDPRQTNRCKSLHCEWSSCDRTWLPPSNSRTVPTIKTRRVLLSLSISSSLVCHLDSGGLTIAHAGSHCHNLDRQDVTQTSSRFIALWKWSTHDTSAATIRT